MIQIKKVDWFRLIAVVAVLIAMFLVFRTCEPSTKIVDIKPHIVEVNKGAEEMKRLKDSTASIIQAKEDTIRALKAEIASTKKQAKKAGDLADRLAKEVISRPDWSEVDPGKCDSLARAVVDFQLLAYEAGRQYDSLIDVSARQSAGMAATIERQQELYANLKKSFDEVAGEYSKVSVALKKETRRRKLDRTIVRIFGAATMVMGGLLLTK